MKVAYRLLVFMLSHWVLSGVRIGYSQEIKWLRVTELQTPVNEVGAEYESEFSQGNTNFFSWPAQYGIDQNTTRMKGLWIGCKNFNDPVEQKLKSVKVIGSGPRNAADRPNQIFEKEIKLIGKYNHPTVIVDGQRATGNDTYDSLDSLDENLPCDRMVLVRFNTSIGISVTKKVMAFAHPNHSNYFINDYVFKNTGIYDRAGNVHQQTLKEVWFYFVYRHAFAGVTSRGFGSTWGAFSATWGNSTIYHAFGQNPYAPEFNNPASPLFQLRGFYSWYGPSRDRQVSYAEDWGCPNEAEDGVLGSAKYAGCVTLHADTSPQNQTDDLAQPKTTWFISPDIEIMSANASQYDEVFMADRYAAMSEGHPDKQHDEYVGNDYPINYNDPRRQIGGGTSQGQGYGPYTLALGDSIHIVFAEGVSGISWEKGREVGANWLRWRNQTGTPTLIMPDGSTTTNYNQYKNAWVFTGKDSILKTFRSAKRNYSSGYTIPQPPPPPSVFTVTSHSDRIQLTWADNATAYLHFNGYVIYRSVGNVLDYRTVYQDIFECGADGIVHSADDDTAVRGVDYYYYIQSKDNGSQNDIEPGKPLYSSLFWTVTSVPTNLRPVSVTTTPSVALNRFELAQNYPNPFNPSTRIHYTLKSNGKVRLSVYDLEGREVAVLVDGVQNAGAHDAVFSGAGLTSGIYFYRLQTADEVITKKMALVR
jgi:hypothetical protein